MLVPQPTTDRRQTSRRRLLKYVGAGSVVGLAGCTDSGSGNGNGGGGGTPTDSGGGNGGGAETSVELTVGLLASLSGPYSGLGVDLREGVKVAKQHLESGFWGDANVETELLVKDTELDPQTGIRRARELTNKENVDVLVGPVSSSVASGVQQHANQNGVLHFHPVSTAERWTAEDCGQYTFRATAHSYMNMKPVAEYAMENVGDTFATVGADYSWGRESVGAFVENAQRINSDAEVVEQTWPKLGTTDFSSHIQRVTASDADFVVVRLTGADIINCIKQMDSFGVQDEMKIVSSNTHTLALGAGEAAVGILGGARYTHVLREEHTGNEQNAKFVADFQAETDRLPTTFAHGGVRLSPVARPRRRRGRDDGHRYPGRHLRGLRVAVAEGPHEVPRVRPPGRPADVVLEVRHGRGDRRSRPGDHTAARTRHEQPSVRGERLRPR